MGVIEEAKVTCGVVDALAEVARMDELDRDVEVCTD